MALRHLISDTTKRNWDKLKPSKEEKLTTRANKLMSKKRILPVEYFSNRDNVTAVIQLLDLVLLNHWSYGDVLYSLGLNLLSTAGILNESHVRHVLGEYGCCVIPQLQTRKLPGDERDFLGLIYQCLLWEGKKNATGSYYTPRTITANMTKGLDFSQGQIFLDPCCGSGSFLLALTGASPEQIYGIDNDPIAVMLAKFNLLLNYPDKVFTPQIYCGDFLQEVGHSESMSKNIPGKFSYIVTNPPWGAITDANELSEIITSKESFTYFFVKAYDLLEYNGILRFLFPESVLNVKCHKDIRRFILDHGRLNRITIYSDSFSGVVTKYIDIELIRTKASPYVTVVENDVAKRVAVRTFYETENLVFHLLDDFDAEIIRTVKNNGCFRLDQSVWALGIVTGDNRKKLKDTCKAGYEQIFTGKEILPYVLKPARKYLLYDRKQLQQVAKEEYYRAPEKLVYKFISKKPVFAYDNTQSLFLNSANILIPNIPNMSIKTVMAFLNSDLFHYIYLQLFGEIKILKGNLLELSFPQISKEQDVMMAGLVDKIISGDSKSISVLQNEIYASFHLNEKQIERIREVVGQKTFTMNNETKRSDSLADQKNSGRTN